MNSNPTTTHNTVKVWMWLCLLLCGCNFKLPPEQIPNPILTDTVVIDGCQYLRSRGYEGFYGYCHKGNCTNQIHSTIRFTESKAEDEIISIVNQTTNTVTLTIPAKSIPRRENTGFPDNVRIKSDGACFIWVDTTPQTERLWDSTISIYGQYRKFSTYEECLRSAKYYVEEMNKTLLESLDKNAMKNWPEVHP